MENLTKIFISKDKRSSRRRPCRFDHSSGKLVGLLGPSGCGKSTTLYLIAGLLRQTEGQIYFDTDEVSEMPPEKRGIGLVFQNYALYPHMTVRENILFPLQNLKVEKEEAKRRTYEMAELVGLQEMLDRKPKELSGGQQQRVAIAELLLSRACFCLMNPCLISMPD